MTAYTDFHSCTVCVVDSFRGKLKDHTRVFLFIYCICPPADWQPTGLSLCLSLCLRPSPFIHLVLYSVVVPQHMKSQLKHQVHVSFSTTSMLPCYLFSLVTFSISIFFLHVMFFSNLFVQEILNTVCASPAVLFKN